MIDLKYHYFLILNKQGTVQKVCIIHTVSENEMKYHTGEQKKKEHGANKKYRPLKGALRRWSAVALGAVLLAGQLDFSVYAMGDMTGDAAQAESYVISVQDAETEEPPAVQDAGTEEPPAVQEVSSEEEEQETSGETAEGEDDPDAEEAIEGKEDTEENLEEENLEEVEEELLDVQAVGTESTEDEGITAYTDERIECEGLKYVILSEDAVGVAGVAIQSAVELTGKLQIPATIEYRGKTYRVVEIERIAFRGNEQIKEIEMPGSITWIGYSAFKDCTGLKKIIFSASLRGIGECAFENCIGLTKVTFPDSLVEIDKEAFQGCTGLTELTMSSGIERIKANAFCDCTNLTTVTVPETEIDYGGGVFFGCSSLTGLAGLTSKVNVIPGSMYNSCRGLKAVTIPDHITGIGEYAFWQCNGLQSVNISSSVQTLGECAFGNCPELRTVFVPDKVTLGAHSFVLCPKLNELRIAVTIAENDGEKTVSPLTLPAANPQDVFGTREEGKNRRIVFLTADGKNKLTGEELETARNAYRSVDDGDTTDSFWYGWRIDDVPVPDDDPPGGGDPPGGDNPPNDAPPGKDKPGGGNDNSGGSGTEENGSDGGEVFTAEQSSAPVPTADTAPTVTADKPAAAKLSPAKPAPTEAAQGKEPVTEDPTHVEAYATAAMIAGLAWLLLWFMQESRGMTEREKEVFVAAFIRWAKRGSRIRKYFALAAIFVLLVYYHSIGRRACAEWNEAYGK